MTLAVFSLLLLSFATYYTPRRRCGLLQIRWRKTTITALAALVVSAACGMGAVVAVPGTPGDSHHPVVPAEQELVVLLHGLGRSRMAMWWLADKLEDAGYQVKRIGYGSLMQSPTEIIEEVSTQIDACCAGHSRKVHFVGHSLGGLVARAYLQENSVEHLGRVVLLGTPNHGSELVDHYRDHGFFSLLGPTTAALGTDEESLPSKLEPPDFPVGVIAGALSSERDNPSIPGPDDGLVSVESNRLEGMKDFIQVSGGHSMMRYSAEVARQTIAFLRTGKFEER